MLRRLGKVIAIIIWGLGLCTLIIPLILYILTGKDWVEDGVNYIEKKF